MLCFQTDSLFSIHRKKQTNQTEQIFLNATIQTGAYIHSRVNRCHNPSFATNVSANVCLSAITKRTKNKTANIKNIIDTIPFIKSLEFIDNIPIISGAKVKTKKPRTEPKPCILAYIVDSSFVSSTGKMPDKIQPPTA